MLFLSIYCQIYCTSTVTSISIYLIGIIQNDFLLYIFQFKCVPIFGYERSILEPIGFTMFVLVYYYFCYFMQKITTYWKFANDNILVLLILTVYKF